MTERHEEWGFSGLEIVTRLKFPIVSVAAAPIQVVSYDILPRAHMTHYKLLTWLSKDTGVFCKRKQNM